MPLTTFFSFFFFNDPAPPEIYTLSLHDALPILATLRISNSASARSSNVSPMPISTPVVIGIGETFEERADRSEEHTSELQSHVNLVCRLLLEKKKNIEFIPPLSAAYRLFAFIRS